jgi:mRNA interferase MazF
VVLVPFQFSEKDVTKHRPAVILSSAAYHHRRNDVIVAAVTSRVRSPLLPGDVVLTHWREAGLAKPSVATCILRTLKRQMIVDKFGELDGRDMALFESAVRVVLELAPAT